MPPPTESFPTSELAQRVASHAQSRKTLQANAQVNNGKVTSSVGSGYDLKKCELLQMVQYSCGLEEAEAKAGVEAGGDFSSSSSSSLSLSSGSGSGSDLKGPSGGSATAKKSSASASAEKVIRCWPVVKLFRRCGTNFMVETTAWEGEEGPE